MNMYLTTYSQLALALPGTDWLYQFTNNLTDLTTANGGALTNLGLTLLSAIAFFQLISMVITFSTANMSVSWTNTPLELGDVVRFMLRLVFCCLLITYWVNPLPATTCGLNQSYRLPTTRAPTGAAMTVFLALCSCASPAPFRRSELVANRRRALCPSPLRA